MPLLFLFIAIPLVEIGLFIQIGGAIGLFPTLAVVVITAILGTALVRSQSALAMSQIRTSFHTMSDPSESLAHGAMILFAGALLLTPGFFTDAVGFALLVPRFRRFVFAQIAKRMTVVGMNTAQRRASDTVVDAEYVDVTPRNGPSGWTKD